MKKPGHVFDRDAEWAALTRFAAARDGVQLGVVSGRRRQGKTFLLQALTRECGGLYFGATQSTHTEALGLLSARLASHLELSIPPRFASWDEAIRYLFTTAGLRAAPIVIDEFPYLTASAPSLPSIVQREIDAAAFAGAGPSLLLCGSALSVMGHLLAGSAPLRGRANLEMVLRPFDYRLAARYWGITDPALAIQTNAVVGGSPAYRSYLGGDRPSSLADFDDWVLRGVLNPLTPLFREARYLLAAESQELRGVGLYHSVLAAVATGNTTRGAIASYIGRKATDISHYLNVCEDIGLLRHENDVFRAGRSQYRITEPLIAFYEAIMRPQWGLLEDGRARAVWDDARARFLAQIIGPHFEAICREYAAGVQPEKFGRLPGEVGCGVISDPARRTQIQIDVAVFAPKVPGQPQRILSLGEAKWGKVMGVRDVQRLARARDLLTARGYDTQETVLACYSGAGFDPELTHANLESVLTVGVAELYHEPNAIHR